MDLKPSNLTRYGNVARLLCKYGGSHPAKAAPVAAFIKLLVLFSPGIRAGFDGCGSGPYYAASRAARLVRPPSSCPRGGPQ